MSAAFHKRLCLPGLDIEDSDMGIVERFAVGCAHGEQDRFGSGQRARVPVLTLAFREVDLDNLLRLAAGRRDAHQPPRNLRDEVNHSISRPRCPHIAFAADISRWAAAKGHFPDYRPSRRRPHKSNPLAVRGEKRRPGIEGERFGLQLAERVQVEFIPSDR